MAWNQTETDLPRDQCIHQLFEIQAQRTPDACALVFKERRLSYRELNERAASMAGELKGLGVGPEMLVGICVERSVEMAVGILAVLKAGGAYVPLDPIYPDERLSAILADAQPRAILTQRHLVSRLPKQLRPVICLDSALRLVTDREQGNLCVELNSENPAYVIFTSGSTGKPKGVLISHQSLVNHSAAMARYYELGPNDRVLQFASFTFDVAAEEIFPTWLTGATVVLWPVTSGVAPVTNFLDFVEEQQITVLNLPAPYWHEWVSELKRLRFPWTVRLVVVGSDRVLSEKFWLWQRHIGRRARFCNAYGPTESTITATLYEPAAAITSIGDCLPIGRPITNTQAYVLDENLKILPVGVTGELHIGGAGLARGYLNLPELTAEKFIPNPLNDETGERLYKTGDLARYLPDGNVEFLSRIDDQVKIRGYRIEIDEIETALRHYPVVDEAVVIAREDKPGEKQLVAYLVVDNAKRPSPEALKSFLRHRLPDYMLPAAFVILKHLPVTPGGKLDRRQLPPPARTRAELGKGIVPPTNELEFRLVEIWEALLGVKPIGIRDDFFELGGHSLLEVRLVAEVEKRLGVTLPLTTLYYTRTIERLARVLNHRRQSQRTNSLIQPYQTEGSKPPVFCHGGSDHLAYYLGADQPFYCLEIHGTNGGRVPGTIEEMAADYVRDIRRVQPRGPYCLIGFCLGGLVLFEAAQQLLRQGENVALLAIIDPTTPWFMEPTSNPPVSKRSLSIVDSAFVEKLRDIAKRISWRIRRAKRVGKRMVCEARLAFGYRVPLFLRDFYLNVTGEEVTRCYVPPVYPGSFILFRRLDNGNESEWRSLAAGEVEIHETWVDHNELLEEPYVQVLAGVIKDHLQRIQAAAPAATVLGRYSHREGHTVSGNLTSSETT
ncbi:MAG: non-ribosomal peptide synthetase [Candidatus Binatia bacterium]